MWELDEGCTGELWRFGGVDLRGGRGGAMYTSSAAQHLLSQSSFVHRLPHSSFKVSACKSSSSAPAALKRLAGGSVLAHRACPSVSHFFPPCSLREGSQSLAVGERWKSSLPALRGGGYSEGADDDDDVYVRSFRPSRGSRSEPVERASSRVGERRNGGDQSRDSYSRFSSDAGEGEGSSRSYTRGSTSAQGERSGFKAGFRDERGSRPFSQGRGGRGGGSSDRVATRESFARAERVEGEDVASSRDGGRGQWNNRGGRGAGRGRGASARGALSSETLC